MRDLDVIEMLFIVDCKIVSYLELYVFMLDNAVRFFESHCK